jgi:hypothetical protein
VTAYDSATVRAYDSATVRAYDSATVTASDSATVTAYGSATVTAYDSATVTASDSATVTAYGSATVTASDSATVTAYDSATVTASDSATVTAYGSATVRAYDSATVRAYDSATVRAYDSATVRAYGSATVRAYGSATVTASKYVAVHLHSKKVKLTGGVVIDVTDIDLSDRATWLDYHGIRTSRGRVVVFKAVDDKWSTDRGFVYKPGAKLEAPDWNARNECGGGLHFSPSPSHALAYHNGATKYVAVSVAVDDLVPITGGTAKCKARACKVLHEVDLDGKKVAS